VDGEGRIVSRGVEFKVTGVNTPYLNIKNSAEMTDRWNIKNYLRGHLRISRN
jgi:hypothetical protein